MVLSGWDSTCSDNESRMYSLSQARQMSGAEGLRDARNNIQFLPSPLTGQYAAQGLIYVDKMQAGPQPPENCPRKPWLQCSSRAGPACWPGGGQQAGNERQATDSIVLPPRAGPRRQSQDPSDFIKLHFISLWEEIKQGRGLQFPLTAWLGYSRLGLGMTIPERPRGAGRAAPSRHPPRFRGTNLISEVFAPTDTGRAPIMPRALRETRAAPWPEQRPRGLVSAQAWTHLHPINLCP